MTKHASTLREVPLDPSRAAELTDLIQRLDAEIPMNGAY